jgi:capsular polysaccharide transport system permease protein
MPKPLELIADDDARVARRKAKRAEARQMAEDAVQQDAVSAAAQDAAARRRRQRQEAGARADAVARSHPAEAMGAAKAAAAMPATAPEVTPATAPATMPGLDPLAPTGGALPAGLPDRTVLSPQQRSRLRAQRKRETRRAERGGVGKTAEARPPSASPAQAPAQASAQARPQTRSSAPMPAPAARRTSPQPAPDPQAEAADALAVFAEIQAEQAGRVIALQRDIASRRRRRGWMMTLRLLLLVILPTALVGAYYYGPATELYVSESAFVVRAASEPPSAAGGLAAALGGGAGGSIQDSISVQDYVLSRDALARLDADLGVIAQWQDPAIDPIQRLRANAGAEDALAHLRSMVSVGYDPAESLIRMEVSATTPAMAQAMSAALIRYAEEMVDGLSTRMRRDMVEDAEQQADAARIALNQANVDAARLQERLRVFSAEAEVGGEQAVIATLEQERESLRARLSDLLTYAPANDPRAEDLRRAIAFREGRIETRRDRIVGGGADGALQPPSATLAGAHAQMERARAEIAARQEMFMSAQSGLEAARLEARRQISYLAVIVPPALADAPMRPRRAANTALAFVIFFGLYLVASLTVSVLREQFSA